MQKVDGAGMILPPNTEKLDNALFYAFDLFQACMLNFFPMNNTAYQMINNQRLAGEKVQLGVRQKDLAPTTRSILKIAHPGIDIQDKKIIIIHEGIEIEVRIIKKHYRVLDNLDQIIYAYETFWIPNPIDSFMRMTRFMH